MMNKKNLKGLNLSELQKFVEELGEKKYRAAQLYGWLYAKAAQSFGEMTDISKEFRTALACGAAISNLQLVTKSVSADGNDKISLQFGRWFSNRKCPDSFDKKNIWRR